VQIKKKSYRALNFDIVTQRRGGACHHHLRILMAWGRVCIGVWMTQHPCHTVPRA